MSAGTMGPCSSSYSPASGLRDECICSNACFHHDALCCQGPATATVPDRLSSDPLFNSHFKRELLGSTWFGTILWYSNALKPFSSNPQSLLNTGYSEIKSPFPGTRSNPAPLLRSFLISLITLCACWVHFPNLFQISTHYIPPPTTPQSPPPYLISPWLSWVSRRAVPISWPPRRLGANTCTEHFDKRGPVLIDSAATWGGGEAEAWCSIGSTGLSFEFLFGLNQSRCHIPFATASNHSLHTPPRGSGNNQQIVISEWCSFYYVLAIPGKTSYSITHNLLQAKRKEKKEEEESGRGCREGPIKRKFNTRRGGKRLNLHPV